MWQRCEEHLDPGVVSASGQDTVRDFGERAVTSLAGFNLELNRLTGELVSAVDLDCEL